MKDIKVPSFLTDHTTLKAGLYLREEKRLNLFTKLKVWDLRFVAPMDKLPISSGALHVIEHMFAFRLRECLTSRYVSCFVYGCRTGLGLITKSNVTEEDLASCIMWVIDQLCPISSVDEVPAMNETQCGSPFLYDIKGANDALISYYKTLLDLGHKSACYDFVD